MQHLLSLAFMALAVVVCGGQEYSTGGYSYLPVTDLSLKPTESTPTYPVHPVRPRNKVHAAVHTKHVIKYVDVSAPRPYIEPQIIEIDANPLPIVMHFKSASSHIRLTQSHKHGGIPEVIETKSEDVPHHLRHEVIRPIVQDVHEVVLPMRRVVQEIRPVVEEIKTIIAKKADEKPGGGGGITGSASFKDDEGKKGGGGGTIGGATLVTPGTVKRSVDYTPRSYYQRYY